MPLQQGMKGPLQHFSGTPVWCCLALELVQLCKIYTCQYFFRSRYTGQFYRKLRSGWAWWIDPIFTIHSRESPQFLRSLISQAGHSNHCLPGRSYRVPDTFLMKRGCLWVPRCFSSHLRQPLHFMTCFNEEGWRQKMSARCIWNGTEQ